MTMNEKELEEFIRVALRNYSEILDKTILRVQKLEWDINKLLKDKKDG